ncbi:MAG: hypothetical protein J7518_05070 [Nocardioidaceae bacterium]|nr:hypothetical protein [Nocardioidaceae bacterium]
MGATEQEQITAWVRGRLPEAWFTEPASVEVDREEIVVVGRLALPDGVTEDTPAEEAREAAIGRITRFREETREDRIRIAREAERRFDRKVAWGAACGSTRALFTNIAAPVMTRLRQPERQVLDTLVEAGVARSRAEALSWCVKLVGEHAEDWLEQLREAMTSVQRLRTEGPQV